MITQPSKTRLMKDINQGLSNTRILLDALRDFRGAFGRFLSLEILFKIIAVALSGPLSAWFLSLVASSTGRLVVSNEELLSLFLSPTGTGLVLLWGTMALVTLLAQQAGPMIIASEARFGRKVTSIEALLLTTRKMPALFNLGLIQVVAFSLIVAPWRYFSTGCWLSQREIESCH